MSYREPFKGAIINTKWSLHTLNARGHILLEVARDTFGLSAKDMLVEIRALRQQVVSQLLLKGLRYESLRSALVPDRKRKEIALIFDTNAIERHWYGFDVFERLVPLFDKNSNHSILVGDYLDHPGTSKMTYDAFCEAVQMVRDVRYVNPLQFYIVYINNLTERQIRIFDDALRGYPAYVGYADTTFSSHFKTLLSTMLVNLGIKQGRVFLQGHESDRADEDDINMCGYPFPDYGYQCRSISSDLMGVLLSYKIERPVYSGFEVDTEFALNAISALPLPLDQLVVQVDEAKLTYIKKEKAGTVQRAGLENISTQTLEGLIKAKLSANYLYHLCVDEKHDVATFNIMLELPQTQDRKATRLLASLKYIPRTKTLSLVTLF